MHPNKTYILHMYIYIYTSYTGAWDGPLKSQLNTRSFYLGARFHLQVDIYIAYTMNHIIHSYMWNIPSYIGLMNRLRFLGCLGAFFDRLSCSRLRTVPSRALGMDWGTHGENTYTAFINRYIIIQRYVYSIYIYYTFINTHSHVNKYIV